MKSWEPKEQQRNDNQIPNVQEGVTVSQLASMQ